MAGPLTAGHVLLKLVADYAGFNEDLDRLGRTATEKFQGVSTAGSLAMTAMGGAIVGALGLAVKGAMDFGSAMAYINSLGIVKDLDGMEEAIKKVATAYGLDLTDAAKAAYQALSGGASEMNTPYLLEQAAKAATAGMTDLTTAVELGTSVNNAFGGNLQEVNKIFDQAFVAVAAGVTEFDALAASVGRVGTTFHGAGLGSDQMFASISALTLAGIQTDEAVTSLKATLNNIINPTQIAKQAAADLGVEFSVGALKAQGLGGFLKGLMDATGGNIETMSKLFGSTEALNAVMALGGQQAAAYDAMLLQMNGTVSATGEAFARVAAEDPALAWRQLKAEFQVLMVEIGQGLLPALGALLEIVKPLIGAVGDFARANPTLTASLTLITAAAGALLVVFGTLGLAMAGLGGALGAVSGIVGALGAAFALVAGVITAVLSAVTVVGMSWALAIGAAVAAVIAAGYLLIENWEYVKDFFVAWWDGIKDVYSQIGQAIMDTIGSAIDWVIDKVSEGWEALKGFFGFGGGDVELPAGSVPGAASGGMVRRGGFVEVGEHGKELLFLPRGAEVVSSPATEAILRGGAGMGGSVNASVVIHSPMVDSEERLQRLAGEISRRQGWMLKEALSMRGV